MANELMIAPLLPSTGYSDNFRTSMNKKKHLLYFNQERKVCSHSGQTGHLNVLEKSWLVQHQRKRVRLGQGSPDTILEGQCPAEFSSNPKQTHLKQPINVLLGILETFREVC